MGSTSKYAEMEKRVGDVVSDHLLRMPHIRDNDESRNKIADWYRDGYRKIPNEIWIYVDINTRAKAEILKEIAMQVYPESAEERKTVEVRFRIRNGLEQPRPYAFISFEGTTPTINQMDFDELEWQSFCSTNFPITGKLVGRWGGDRTVLQLERNGRAYILSAFDTNGNCKTTALNQTSGRRDEFTNGVRIYKIVQEKLAVTGANGTTQYFTKLPSRKLPLNELKTLDTKATSLEKKRLKKILSRLLDAADNEDFNYQTFNQSGKYQDIYFEVHSCDRVRPQEGAIPFELRKAPRLLQQFALAYGPPRFFAGQNGVSEASIELERQDLIESSLVVLNSLLDSDAQSLDPEAVDAVKN